MGPRRNYPAASEKVWPEGWGLAKVQSEVQSRAHCSLVTYCSQRTSDKVSVRLEVFHYTDENEARRSDLTWGRVGSPGLESRTMALVPGCTARPMEGCGRKPGQEVPGGTHSASRLQQPLMGALAPSRSGTSYSSSRKSNELLLREASDGELV